MPRPRTTWEMMPSTSAQAAYAGFPHVGGLVAAGAGERVVGFALMQDQLPRFAGRSTSDFDSCVTPKLCECVSPAAWRHRADQMVAAMLIRACSAWERRSGSHSGK